MGSIHENTNKEKRLRRYRDHTGAGIRIAQYVNEHVLSEKIKNLADRFLIPQALIRRFMLCAKTKDGAEFDALLSDSNTRKKLSASKKFFFQKPEVYLKAFALFCFPGLYYQMRS